MGFSWFSWFWDAFRVFSCHTGTPLLVCPPSNVLIQRAVLPLNDRVQSILPNTDGNSLLVEL